MNGQTHLILDSRDQKEFGSSTSQCSFQLREGLNKLKSIELLSFSCPLTMYNVNSSNNMIYFNDSTNKSVAIPPSNYNIITFCDIIKTTMESVSSLTFTVTFSETTLKINVAASGFFYFTFGTNKLNAANYIMGYLPIDTPASDQLFAPNSINLSIPLYFLIKIDSFSTNTKSSNPYDNSTFTVFTKGNNSDVLTWNTNEFYQQTLICHDDNIQTINVTLTDYGNKLLDLNNANWAMLLKLNY